MTEENKTKIGCSCGCGTLILLAIIAFLLIHIYGCAKTNVAETTPKFAGQQAVVSEVQPKVKVWPDYIEIKTKAINIEGTDYRVNYKYFKETKESGVVAKLSLEPIDSKDKLPSEIYINKSGKVLEVGIWGVGDYDCPSDYAKMCGSVCAEAEQRYFDICEAQMRMSVKGMTCKETVEEILLKEPAEWL